MSLVHSAVRRRWRALVATIVGASTLAIMPTAASAQAGPASPVFINEFHYDNAGSDVGEFVEIAGPAGTDLTDWSVVLYNGSNSAPYATIDLAGTIDDEGAGYGAVSFDEASIQNGSPDALALVDATGNVAQFWSYEGTLTATGGNADGVTSTDVGVSETSSTPAGESLQLTGDGTVAGDFAWTGPSAQSPGTLNSGQTFGDTPPPPPPAGNITPIHDVQGSGAVSPLNGQTVTINGIVVGDFQAIATDDPSNDEPLQGFFVQEQDADGDAATSEGIFVYTPDGADVSVGDEVDVTGAVNEFFELTEITSVSSVTIVSSDNPLPVAGAPVMPTTTADPAVDWERFEGMRVAFNQTLTVTNLFPLGSFGEVELSSIGAQDHPNQTNPVGSAASTAQRLLNENSRITLEDGEDEDERFPQGLSTWNPEPTPFLGGPDNTLRSGDTVDNLTGVVFYDSESYEVLPVNQSDPTDPQAAVSFTRNDRPATKPSVGGSLTVASFNVLNYFTTIDNGQAICGPAGSQQRCRGADTVAEFDLQSTKIATAISKLDTDIVGLIEIENSGTNAAIADLVAKVNAQSGRTYDFVETGFIGTDAISVGFIYDTATVNLNGGFAVLDSTVSPAFIDDKNRPALAQTFTERSTGADVTVAVNHLKSKGSSCDTVVNPGDPARGVAGYAAGADVEDPNLQGNCSLTRTAAADVLGKWLAEDPTQTGATKSLILGDLNAYANETPITILEGQSYTDLVEASAGGNGFASDAHSYVFDGEHGTLDYAMANSALAPDVSGAAVWHINADEPFALDYQNFNPAGQATLDEWKSSDHDPVLVGLNLSENSSQGPTCNGLEATIVGTEGRDFLRGTPGPDVIVALGGSDTVVGRGGDDVICLGKGADRAWGGPGDDTIFGEQGRDTISGQRGDDSLDGGPGRDVGFGGNGTDTCSTFEVARNCEA